MKPSDATGVAALQVECWRKAYAGIIPEKYLASMSVDSKAKLLENGLAANDDVLRFVALEKNVLMGFIAGLENRSLSFYPDVSCEAWSIYVHPDQWKKGIGKLLIQNFMEEMKKKNHKSMLVWALEENMTGRGFYEAMGGKLRDQKQTVTYGGKHLVEVAYSFQLQ
ncbi:MAG: GNAT family N-acetyltransferase [Bdellovibrionota bacterium]